MNQPQPYPPGAYTQQPQRSGPNTALVVTLVVLLMTLVFVLVFFLFIQDSDDASTSTTTTTIAPSATPETTVAAATPTTVVATPAATAPPTTELALAPCVNGEIASSTTGRRGEIALYQTTLKDLGFDPGDIDGFFGPNTAQAASDEVFANGNINGPDGMFAEIFPDDGAFLPAVFERLGIACP